MALALETQSIRTTGRRSVPQSRLAPGGAADCHRIVTLGGLIRGPAVPNSPGVMPFGCLGSGVGKIFHREPFKGGISVRRLPLPGAGLAG